MRLLLIVFGVSSCVKACLAIRGNFGGERSGIFVKCYQQCFKEEEDSTHFAYSQILAWSRDQECRYRCMWVTEEQAGDERNNIKYFGKWPFKRVVGIQEPLSTLFSMTNLIANVIGYYIIYQKGVQPAAMRHRWFLDLQVTIFFIASVIAWMASMIYHIRELWWAERFDYAAAFFWIVAIFSLAIFRTFSIRSPKWQLLLSGPLYSFTVLHMIYICLVRLNHRGSQVLAGIILILAGALLLTWSLWQLYRRRRSHTKYFIIVIILNILVAFLLDMFDFPPIYGYLDAHASWHAVTALITPLFYIGLRNDALWDLRDAEARQMF